MSEQAAADLVLASASPRRRELLGQLGLVLEVTPANVDETPLPGERPADYVRRVAAGLDLDPSALDRKVRAGGWALSGLSTRHASLEDVFVSLTGRQLRE